jgi:arylsulfatase A-like enzyme
MCSPTRASLLTGRNHHAVGVGFLVDLPMAYPGYSCRIPPSAAPLPRVLRDAGYSTLAVGKWHLTPRGERGVAGPFSRWPLGYGFERFYGFLQGDTSQWTPHLVCDNHYVDPPARPEDGYHLSADLADRAIGYLLDQHHSAPGKPFFLYLALGATHAPHHVPAEWIEAYRGRFDRGWDEWRAETFSRQQAAGIVPEGTVLTERPGWVPAWEDIGAEERRMHARQQEVYAAFLSHADAQIGRVLEFLAATGRLDDTVVVLTSDNGASAEGGLLGTFNEHRFTAQLPESVAGNGARLDQWGSFRSYPHYSWGWAWAGNTPLRLWKRYTWLGGTRTPLIVSWPAGIGAAGEVRSQFCHAVDLMPTILDACGVERPAVVDGVTQEPFDGASMRPTFSDRSAAEIRATQYFELLGSRSMYHDGWKATTDHVSAGVRDEELLMTGSRDFATDHWSLFRLDDDFSEARDVSSDHPGIVRRLQEMWAAEAGRNHVLPLVSDLIKRFSALIGPEYPPAQPSVFRPGGAPVPDESVPPMWGGFTVTAVVDVPDSGAEGILCALGDWSGGWAFYAVNGRLAFAVRPGGELVRLASRQAVPAGPQLLSVRGTPRPEGGCRLSLHFGSTEVAAGDFPQPLPIVHQHGGAGLTLGHDRGFPVTDDYRPPFAWTGTLQHVVVDTPGGRPPAVLDEVRRALHAD